MNPTFYIHLIATIVNIFFIIMLWWYNRKLININYDLMKDNREILVEAKRIQDRVNNLDIIVKAFEKKTYSCFYCHCDIDTSKDVPFIHKDTFKHEWRCIKCDKTKQKDK